MDKTEVDCARLSKTGKTGKNEKVEQHILFEMLVISSFCHLFLLLQLSRMKLARNKIAEIFL